jgi:hypothetical protein
MVCFDDAHELPRLVDDRQRAEVVLIEEVSDVVLVLIGSD